MGDIKHTPGPWFSCSGNAGERYQIECKGSGNDDYPIARLRGPDREANARLIAAAPELLEACKLAEICTHSVPEGMTLDEAAQKVRTALRAAIRKAEGGEA